MRTFLVVILVSLGLWWLIYWIATVIFDHFPVMP